MYEVFRPTLGTSAQGRRNVFQSGEAERSDNERSESRAKRVFTAGGLGGAVSPPGGVRGNRPEKIFEYYLNLKQFGAIWRNF